MGDEGREEKRERESGKERKRVQSGAEEGREGGGGGKREREGGREGGEGVGWCGGGLLAYKTRATSRVGFRVCQEIQVTVGFRVCESQNIQAGGSNRQMRMIHFGPTQPNTHTHTHTHNKIV